MSDTQSLVFNTDVWKPALDKFGAVTHLTVILYDADERIVCGPTPSTTLFAVFEKVAYDPGIFVDCARRCLAQAVARPALVVAPSCGLAVVGTSLLLEGTIVGAAVAGYALVGFSQASAIEQLAREAGVPFRDLWEMARQQQPVPQRRLVLHGELLQVLGDAILRENYRTRQYEDTAARLEKEMSAKDEFFAVLSHELRTPLTPILGWASLLKASDSPEHRLKAVETIQRNAHLEIKLIDDLLDINRIIKGKMPLDMSIHDLSDLLRAAVDTIMDTAASKKIDVEFAGTPCSLMLEGDAVRLQQVFVNILSNAVKFTPGGGRVRITVELEANDVMVQIADSGKGIERAFLPHVFEMFRQQEQGTRKQYAGLGIGLALVKRLVELHRGRVEIASEGEGRGTQVTVRLPLATPAQPASIPDVPGEDDSLPLRDFTILAVEDTEDTLETLRRMLETLGAHVLVARDGVEALEALGANPADVVLCDLRMPRMDGFEFLRELRRIQDRSHLPVIAISGLTSEADHQRTQAAGFQGHLDKPFDDAILVSSLQPLLNRRRHRVTSICSGGL